MRCGRIFERGRTLASSHLQCVALDEDSFYFIVQFFLVLLKVRELVERCSCPTQFPMIRVAEGKYRIGNTKVMIYVRVSKQQQ